MTKKERNYECLLRLTSRSLVPLSPNDGRYGVNILKGVWHTIEVMEANSVIFECKEGPFVEHEEDGILNI